MDFPTLAQKSKKIYLEYRAEDFLLYAVSLISSGVLLYLAFPFPMIQVVVWSLLFFMALMFVKKHGVKFDPSALGCLAANLYAYPIQVFQEWALVRFVPFLLPLSLLFAIALDDFLEKHSVGPAWASEPLPIWVLVSAHFAVGTYQRLRIHFAHMRQKGHVRDVLMESVWKKHIRDVGIGWHIHHALVTGILCQATNMAVPIATWVVLQPSYRLEMILIVLNVGIWRWTRRGHPVNNELVFHRHRSEHRSRFRFAVLHGHHHDAIPIGSIGAAGVGLLEGFHRTLFHYPLGFGSVAIGLLAETGIVLVDMRRHQYVPGVYPFTRGLIRGKVHHAVHHYGSYLPLGTADGSNLDRDDTAGYVRDNPKARWFCRMTERLEKSLDSETSAFLAAERQPDGP